MDSSNEEDIIGLMAWCTDCGKSFQFIKIEDGTFDLENHKDVIRSLLKESRCSECFGRNLLEHDPEIDSEIDYENPNK